MIGRHSPKDLTACPDPETEGPLLSPAVPLLMSHLLVLGHEELTCDKHGEEVALKADFGLLASGTALVGPAVHRVGLVDGEHQLRRCAVDTICPQLPFQPQLLQARLRRTVPRLVLAQKQGNALCLFLLVPHGAD